MLEFCLTVSSPPQVSMGIAVFDLSSSALLQCFSCCWRGSAISASPFHPAAPIPSPFPQKGTGELQ